jgi:cytochrome c peroxidase
MPRMVNRFFLLALAGISFLSSCVSDRVDIETRFYSAEEYETLRASLKLPEAVDDYSLSGALGNSFIMNHEGLPGSATNMQATLGRVLFYDTQLSKNNSVSCASCHKQELAFSDDRPLSMGFEGRFTKRNSIPLAASANFVASYEGGNSNMIFSDHTGAFAPLNLGFLWDERAATIHEQSAMAIEDPVEMGMNLEDLAVKLSIKPHYRILFKKAFGEERITPSNITMALQVFLNSLSSVNSKFDQGLSRQGNPTLPFQAFSPQENIGKAIYMTNCSNCHGQDMTNPVMRIANNGLDQQYTDQGVGEVTQKSADMGLFKVPFLRNIALTAPYMHDGRFNTLEEVVEHYSSGIQDHPNLHSFLKSGDQPRRFNFSAQQKAALVAFLQTLTDDSTIMHSRFSDPFK